MDNEINNLEQEKEVEVHTVCPFCGAPPVSELEKGLWRIHCSKRQCKVSWGTFESESDAWRGWDERFEEYDKTLIPEESIAFVDGRIDSMRKMLKEVQAYMALRRRG